MSETNLTELGKSLRDLREKEVEELVSRAIDAQQPPLEIIDELSAGMDAVGALYKEGDYFLSELIFSGEIFKKAMGRLKAIIESGGERQYSGRLILGTVKGDIHDLGKNIVITLLECAGFEVVDLGVDVPPDKFVEAMKNTPAAMIGLSGLITTAFDSMKETVEALKQAGLRESVKIMIGGGPTNDKVREYVEADFYGPDATSAVDLAKELMC